MSKYKILSTTKFKKDVKLAKIRGYNLELLKVVVIQLSEGKILDSKYKDHSLKGKLSTCRECHITPDWLLIYEITKDELILYLTRTGTHNDLF